MDVRTRRLLTAPIVPTLARMAAPNILVMAVQTSVGLIETYFVSMLGTDALAGMALVFPVVMLVQMLSAGGMGGAIQSAVSRTLGADRQAEAGILAWHAMVLGLGLGIATSLVALPFGPTLYAAMGGTGGSLRAATTYASIVFGGAVLIWLFNALSAVIRGTGNMVLPAIVTCVGAIVLIPLSPALIFGWGPFPEFGVAGGGVAFAAYYAAGSAVFAAYIWSGRSVLRPSRRLPALSWGPSREILRIGVLSGIASMTSNVTVIVATGFAGAAGPAAVAGYGTGARLEYLLVPLVFGLGSPIAAIVGTALGAGDHARARQAALTGALIAGVLTEFIGLAAALHPAAWLGLFAEDPAMLATGSLYLRIVGPFYGFFGFGLALYFAAQGAGRVGWPLAASLLRMGVALGGAWLALALGLGLAGTFIAMSAGFVIMGLVNAAAFATGKMFPGDALGPPSVTSGTLTPAAGVRR
ncbi:MATE family efflux transporter [Methylorubrum extorquens]|uniref:MATE family efflux transporter n=1 Tax=Methylorubrum extorquens TaxID=408 RepID=UPI0001629923|nr:MATE family efflux transporter [Methylorubrum extorquens]ABY32169.1 MATE efflux family protein [Methylorubrum extorquens PA1]KQP92937.1 MATE family efflux transporter [Methylobacterium sp. Leaf119]WIU38774.1 MATE family efflux transporter [Methylorubrum extorquens]